MQLIQKVSQLLGLKYLGILITVIIILSWIGVWAIIAFLATDAGDHILGEWSAFRSVAFIIGNFFIVLFHIFSAFSTLSTLHWRLLWLGYHLIRWPYFVLMLLSNNTLVQDFAFAFDLVLFPSVGIVVGLWFAVFYCYRGIKKEIKTVS